MDQISKVLFVISNSLLIPDILFLIILFIRSLILVGGFYNSFMQRRRMNALLGDVRALNAGNLSELSGRLPKSNRSPFIDHLDDLLTREGLTEDYANYVISSYENVCEKDLSLSKLLTKGRSRARSGRDAHRYEPCACRSLLRGYRCDGL